MAEPLLSLSTLAPERPHIEIDDVPYAVRVRDDMGLEHLARLDGLMHDYYGLMMRGNAGERLTRADSASLSIAIKEVIEIFLDAPTEVTDKLTDAQRLQLCQLFSAALSPQTPQAIPRKPPAAASRSQRRQTGAKSSQRSSASTAATLKAG